MAHQDVVDTLRVEVRYQGSNTNAANVFHVRTTAAPTLPDLTTAATIFESWLSTEWAPIANGEWEVAEIVVTDLSSITGPRRSFIPAAPIVGTAVGDSVPANATIAIKFDIGTRGRGVNGRMFWVGLSEADTTANEVTTAALTAILSAIDALRTAVEAGAGLEGLAIPHYVVGGVRPAICTSSVVLAVVAADGLIDSQRDRLPRHKKHKRSTP